MWSGLPWPLYQGNQTTTIQTHEAAKESQFNRPGLRWFIYILRTKVTLSRMEMCPSGYTDPHVTLTSPYSHLNPIDYNVLPLKHFTLLTSCSGVQSLWGWRPELSSSQLEQMKETLGWRGKLSSRNQDSLGVIYWTALDTMTWMNLHRKVSS